VRAKGGQGGENEDVAGKPEEIIPNNHIGRGSRARGRNQSPPVTNNQAAFRVPVGADF